MSDALFDLPAPEPGEPRGRRQPRRREQAPAVIFEEWIDRRYACGHNYTHPAKRARHLPHACPACGCDGFNDVAFRQTRLESA